MRKNPIARLLEWERTNKQTPPPINDGPDVFRDIPCEGFPVTYRPLWTADRKFMGWEAVKLRWITPDGKPKVFP